MSRFVSASDAIRATQVACVLALAILLFALFTASRVPMGDELSMPATVASHAESARAAVNDAEFARAVATDLFADDRAAPSVRYRVGATESKSAAFVAPLVVAPQLKLAGTVIAADGHSFAMCQIGAEPAKIVYVGQRIGTFTLRGVSQGSAVFTDDSDKRVVLRVPNGG